MKGSKKNNNNDLDFVAMGNRLTDLRKAKGLLQVGVIEKLERECKMKISPATYSRVENGTYIPSVQLLHALAKIYHKDISYILYGYLPTGDNFFTKILKRFTLKELGTICRFLQQILSFLEDIYKEKERIVKKEN